MQNSITYWQSAAPQAAVFSSAQVRRREALNQGCLYPPCFAPPPVVASALGPWGYVTGAAACTRGLGGTCGPRCPCGFNGTTPYA